MAGSRLMLRGSALAFALAAFMAGAKAETVRVTIQDLGFLPAAIAVNVGDIIEWANADFVAHTATAMNGEWDVVIEANAVGRITVSKAGMVQYFCQFHPNMLGTVTVLAH
jgi:plastocyanin